MENYKFTVKKSESIEKEIAYEIKDINNFFGRFYNYCNQECWCGVILKGNKKYFIIRKEFNQYQVEEYKNWQNFDLQIKNFFQKNEFLNEITREQFLAMIPFDFSSNE